MSDRETVTILDNVPFTGTLKYADERTTQHGQRVKLAMELDPGQERYAAGMQDVWLNGALIPELVELGAIVISGKTEKGNVLKVQGRPHLRILREQVPGEDGGKAKTRTNITRLDRTPSAPKPAQPPVEPSTPRAGAEQERKEYNAARQLGEELTPEQQAEERAKARKTMAGRWVSLYARYEMAFQFAARAQARTLGVPMAELEASAVQAGAATLLIAAQNGGMDSDVELAGSLQTFIAQKYPAPTAQPQEAKEDDDLPF